MKFTAIFLLIAVLHAGASGHAQSVSISVKDLPLEKVLMEIKKQTGYTFVYTENLLQKAKRVTLSVNEASLVQVLNSCFADQPLSYSIVNKIVVVREAVAGRALDEYVFIKVSGTVSSVDGKPLAGATIMVKGSVKATVTNELGYFEIAASPGDVLIATFIGFESRSIKLTATASLSIVMTPVMADIDSVTVVNTGYQELPKERATGSFGSISAKQIAGRVAPNILERIEGTVSGLLVNVGQPDRSLLKGRDNFTIRGVSTINSVKQPLIVIDGFPTELDLVNINPADIEKITVLKDAAAASIWGVRAANGVLVIDTKKGAYNYKPSVNFSTNLTLTGRPRLDYMPVLNSSEYLAYEKELVDKNILPLATSPLVLFQAPLTPGATLALQLKRGTITQAQYDQEIARLGRLAVNDQYQDYLLQSPFSQQYNVSVSGGSALSRSYLSASYTDEKPNAQKDYGRRLIVSFNNQTKISNKISFTAETFISLLRQKNNGIGLSAIQPGATTLLPYDQLIGSNGNPADFSYRASSTVLDSLQGRTFLPWKYNYLNELANADKSFRSTAYRLAAGLKYNIVPTLSAEVKYMLEKSYEKTRNYYNSDTYLARNAINSFITTDTHVKGIPTGGILDLTDGEQNNYSLRGQLNFNPNLGNDHQLDFLAGVEVRETVLSTYSNRSYGYDDRLLTSTSINYSLLYKTVDGNQRVPFVQTFGNRKDRYFSGFGNFTYTYKGKYSLSGSARKDDSNLFGASDEFRSVPLWSVGAMWRLKEENFMQRSKWIDQLNIRATAGYNGNVNKETSPYLIMQPSAPVNTFNSNPFATVFNPANPLLRWERVRTFNFGIDYSIFNRRLSGTIDAYTRKSMDLLGRVETNPTYGFTTLLANQLEMTSKGIDLTIEAKAVTTPAFTWMTSLNIAYNNNKVTKAYFQQNTTDYYTNASNPIEGKPLGALYTYRFAGLNSNGNALLYNGNKDKFLADLTTFPNTDLAALSYEGVTSPPWFGGFANTFVYKNFELYALITFKAEHKFIRPTLQDVYTQPYTRIAHKDLARRWQKTGDELNTDVPAIDALHTGLYRYRASDNFVEDASYIRWRDITLTYKMPRNILKHTPVKTLDISVSGRNLALWTANKYSIDPDYIPVSTSVILPPSRSIVLSIKANF